MFHLVFLTVLDASKLRGKRRPRDQTLNAVYTCPSDGQEHAPCVYKVAKERQFSLININRTIVLLLQ